MSCGNMQIGPEAPRGEAGSKAAARLSQLWLRRKGVGEAVEQSRYTSA
jgi:hypothetical protein